LRKLLAGLWPELKIQGLVDLLRVLR
jgi:hypothetical protein